MRDPLVAAHNQVSALRAVLRTDQLTWLEGHPRRASAPADLSRSLAALATRKAEGGGTLPDKAAAEAFRLSRDELIDLPATLESQPALRLNAAQAAALESVLRSVDAIDALEKRFSEKAKEILTPAQMRYLESNRPRLEVLRKLAPLMLLEVPSQP
ncbi:MAG: hypothetical protein EB084_21755 [Proteobacteria bacterium]|nr:hypothetical protein [Pseudomonadota bacterium]